MKGTITLFLILLYSSIGFSQNRTQLHGRILSQETAVIKADIINFTTKISTISNENGEFFIEAKPNDLLIVISDETLDKKMTLSPYEFYNPILNIRIEKKPIELDEVKIRAQQSVKNLVTYDELAKIRIAEENSPLRNAAVYDGKIINGADFIQIAKMIGKLFKSKKSKKKMPSQNLDFTDYASSNFSDTFFIKTLDLKPDEIALFLDYCEADPKSKEAIKSDDEFTILDFLITKKADFRKMLSENKK